MIRAMRASAKWVMGVLVVAFVGWMVFDVGMGISGGGTYRPGDAIAEVNGQRIDLQEYYAALRNAQENQRRQSGSAPVTQEDQKQLENSVMESLIQDVLLHEEYQRRHITVSPEEIVAAAQNAPPPEIQNAPEFQTDGKFDPTKWQRFLASGADPNLDAALEAQYRQEIPRAKLFNQLVADIYVPDEQLWQAYQDDHDSATIKLLSLYPDVVIPDSAVHVSDAEVEQYYQDHRADFDRTPVAYMSYAVVHRIPNAADSAAALAHAKAVREEIVKGADFAAVAKRESVDSASAVKGGDLGEVTRGSFVPQFEKAALALAPGQISQPVLSPFGYHIIKLISKSGNKFHAAHILIHIGLVGAHQDSTDAAIDNLDRRAGEQADGAELDSAAAAIGAKVHEAAPVREGDRVLAGGVFVPDAALWAFDDARPGETSSLIETDQASYIFRLDSLTPGGVPELSAIHDAVRSAVVLQKKKEAARQLAQTIVADIQADRTTLDAVAKRYQAPLTTLGPFTRTNPSSVLRGEAVIVGAAFGVPLDHVSPPIVGEHSVFLVEPVARHAADSTAFVKQLPALRAEALQSARQNRVRLVLSSLRAQAKVDDRRKALQEAQKNAEELQQVQQLRSGARGGKQTPQ
jgi:peptidyl-prolyl cis-trans isomerase D